MNLEQNDLIVHRVKEGEELGPLFRALRENAGVSCRSAANFAGVSYSNTSLFEREQRNLHATTFVRLLDAIGYDMFLVKRGQ